MNVQKLRRAKYNLITFVISKFISSFGSSTYNFGISLYILSMTGSATSFALNFIFSSLPRITFSPFAGYVADRYSKKTIVIISQLMSVMIVSILLITTLFNGLSIIAIYVTTGCLAVSSLFNSISFNASIMNLIKPEHTQKAISLNETARTLGSISGPILGGILFAIFNIKFFLLFFMISFSIAALLESTMNFKLFSSKSLSKETNNAETLKSNIQPRKNKIMVLNMKKVFQDLKQGVLYLKSNKLIRVLVLGGAVTSFFFTSIQVGMPYILITLNELSSYKYGLVQSSFSIGMIITTVFLSIKKEFNFPFIIAKKALIVLSFLFLAIVIPLFDFFPDYFVFIYYFIWAITLGISMVLMNTPVAVKLIKLISEEFRGRVIGLIDTMTSSLSPLGIVFYGLLFDFLNAIIIMLITSLLSLVCTVYLLRKSVLAKAHPDYFRESS